VFKKLFALFLIVILAAASTTVSFAGSSDEIILYAKDFKVVGSSHWSKVNDPEAVSGVALKNSDKYSEVQESPTDYVEAEFNAEAGKKYYIFIRGKADIFDGNTSTDALWVQFDGSVDASGKPIVRIGTKDALMYNGFYYFQKFNWLGGDAGNENNGHDPHVVMFEKTGRQVIRIQSRQAPMRFDEVLISATQTTIPEPQDKVFKKAAAASKNAGASKGTSSGNASKDTSSGNAQNSNPKTGDSVMETFMLAVAAVIAMAAAIKFRPSSMKK